MKKKKTISVYPLLFIFLHLIGLIVGTLLAAFLLAGEMKTQEGVHNALMSSDANNLGSILGTCILVPLFYLFLRWRKRENPQIFLNKKPTTRQFFTSVFWVFAAQGLALCWLLFLEYAQEFSEYIRLRLEQYNLLISGIVSDNQNILLMVLATSVFVPLLEELLYRGIVLGELRRTFSDRVSLVIQAAIFGLVHGNFVQSVYAFVLALVIGYIYLKWESFILCFSVHAVFNFLGGALPQILPEQSILLQFINGLQFISLILVGLYLLFSAAKNKGGQDYVP